MEGRTFWARFGRERDFRLRVSFLDSSGGGGSCGVVGSTVVIRFGRRGFGCAVIRFVRGRWSGDSSFFCGIGVVVVDGETGVRVWFRVVEVLSWCREV